MAADDASYFEQAPLLGAYSSGISVPSAPQEPLISGQPEGLEMSYTPLATQVLEPPKMLGGEPPVVRDRTILQEEGFTVADALAAMERHAQSKCCLKSKITHELTVIEMRVRSATHLTFESFTEGRSVVSDQAPYTPGTIVDGPQSGPAPAPWDIPAQPSALFQNQTTSCEVPHTSVVVGCDSCGRRGQVACTVCVAGFRSCLTCHGRGTVESHHHHNTHSSSHHSTSSTSHHHHSDHHHHHHHSCHSCAGTGRTRCITCAGTGFVQCRNCRGSGLVRCFTKLTVQWRLYQNERVLDSGTLPHNLIMGAGGVTMFQEEDTVVRPVAHLPSAEINQAANELMGSQRITPNEQLQRQRIRIRSIPIYEVHYTYKGSERKTFWVYGTDRQVFEEHYPLCLPCTLL